MLAFSLRYLTEDWAEALATLNNGLAARSADPEARAVLEQEADAWFGASRNLLVYGSLAPGQSNHGLLTGIHGTWTRGWVTGDLVPTGWGAALGYPALRCRPDGPRVEAWLLQAADLPARWSRLDAIEGPAYHRLLAPLWTPAGLAAVGYLYAAADPGPSPEGE